VRPKGREPLKPVETCRENGKVKAGGIIDVSDAGEAREEAAEEIRDWLCLLGTKLTRRGAIFVTENRRC
jgi:hypothetical protein